MSLKTKQNSYKVIPLWLTIFVVCAFSLFSCQQENPHFKNIVLMIGDGLGFNHIKVAQTYREETGLFMQDKATLTAQVRTSSLNNLITDSAAAATAMATGHKVNNGEIAYHDGTEYETILELAERNLKGTGVIATEGLYGATPASFTSHSESRSNIDSITQQQMSSNIDLFLGAGQTYYDGFRNTIFNNRRYTNNFSELNSWLDLGKTSVETQRFLGAFSSIALNQNVRTDTTPSLLDLSLSALNYLENRYQQQGFFLMIESSNIDKQSHGNNLAATIDEIIAFDEAIQAVVKWAKKDQETLVIVTADHETGGLSYHNETGEDLTNTLFTTTGHSSCNVPLFLFQSYPSSLEIRSNAILDNTDIYWMMYRIMVESDG